MLGDNENIQRPFGFMPFFLFENDFLHMHYLLLKNSSYVVWKEKLLLDFVFLFLTRAMGSYMASSKTISAVVLDQATTIIQSFLTFAVKQFQRFCTSRSSTRHVMSFT